MDLNKISEYLIGRVRIEKIPVNWDSGAYTSDSFNAWAAGPAFKEWAGEKETAAEVDVMAKLLRVLRGESLLDVACGYGRHALVFAGEYGLKVTGIDISTGLITAAKRLAKEKGLDITYDVKLATDLPWDDKFSYVMIAENTFSLFGPDAPKVLRGIHRALKKGGKLFLDLDNKPYYCRYGTRTTHWYQYPGDLVLQEVYFHKDISVETGRDINFKKGAEKAEDFIIFKRIYDLKEIKKLLNDNGFRIGKVYGDWDLSKLKDSSPKMILTGMKV